MIINKKEHDYVVHNEKEIRGFFGEYRFLSNFHQCPVYFEGALYPSTENAFMAAKTIDVNERLQFRNIDPKEAKSLGRQIKLRSDWEEVKYDVMATVIFDKFYRNKGIRAKLISTGNAYLEETNHWNDRIWGVCEGEGQNNLGKILMNIRSFWQNHQK
jgi:ribA/ribD-fused uncharacterized protein